MGGAVVGPGVRCLSTGCCGSRGRPPPQDSAPAHGGCAIYTAEPGEPFIGDSLCAPPEACAKLPLTLQAPEDTSLSDLSLSELLREVAGCSLTQLHSLPMSPPDTRSLEGRTTAFSACAWRKPVAIQLAAFYYL